MALENIDMKLKKKLQPYWTFIVVNQVFKSLNRMNDLIEEVVTTEVLN